MNPLGAKTFHTSFRGEVTDLAVLARWFVKRGFLPRSRNELIAYAVDRMAKLIVGKNPELAVLTLSDAYALLDELGLVGTNRPNVFPTESAESWNLETVELGLTPSAETALVAKAVEAENSNLASSASELHKRLLERRARESAEDRALNSPEGLRIED